MRIYLDHNAGTPLRPEAHAAMLAVLGPPANPSSAHREGARASSSRLRARAPSRCALEGFAGGPRTASIAARASGRSGAPAL